jgi:TonB family protein
MKVNVGRIVFVICLLALSSINRLRAQQNGAPIDDVTIVEFKDLDYPIPAQIGRLQGAVVVQVKLDDKGGVTDAALISGHPYLAFAALNNVKKWRFRPNVHRSAIVVYNFIFLEGRCESHSSLFVLQPSNVATVIACSAAVNSSTSR